MYAAFFEISSAKVTQLVMNLVAVAGGFLIGYVVTWLLGKAFDRWIVGRPTPEALHKAANYIGGLIGAIIVALIVFGGGSGTGDGSGSGDGDKDKSGKIGGTGTGDATTPTTGQNPPPIIPKDPPTQPEGIKITILGGEDVREERFYVVGADGPPQTFEELKRDLLSRKTTKPLALEVRFSPRNIISRDHIAVRQVVRWAESSGLSLTFPGNP